MDPPQADLNRPPSPHRTSDQYSPSVASRSAASPTAGKPVSWNPALTTEAPNALDSSPKITTGIVRDVFVRWRQKVREATRKAEDLAGNVWQHLKTGPSLTDAAMGRIAQGTKVIAEGGYEKIFQQTFDTIPEEHLLNSYACYFSTSAGPVMGILYLSTMKLAFCSDDPLPYNVKDQTEWSYYKVIIPLNQLKAVNPSTNTVNSAEKYIQLLAADGREFWFMGFVNYEGAVMNLGKALQVVSVQKL